MPSLLEDRISDLELDADILGVVGVEGDADFAGTIEGRRFTEYLKHNGYGMRQSHEQDD